jgi:hypothetical protein
MARGSERNHAETAQDEPTIGNGPRIKINQRSRDTMTCDSLSLACARGETSTLVEVATIDKQFAREEESDALATLSQPAQLAK